VANANLSPTAAASSIYGIGSGELTFVGSVSPGPLGIGGAGIANSQFSVLPRNAPTFLTGSENPWLLAEERIAEFSLLPPNWDHYGALAINAQTKDNAITALVVTSNLLPQPEITPNTNGTLSFEWEVGGNYACLEIGMTKFSLIVRQSGSKPALASGRADMIDGSIGTALSQLLESRPSASINSGLFYQDQNLLSFYCRSP